MHIGIIKLTEPNIINGRLIATNGFNEALIKHKGNHEVTFIVPNEWEKMTPNDVCLKELKTFINENPFDVIHYPSVAFYRALLLKNYNPKKLTVTGVTSTISHNSMFEWAHMLGVCKPSSNDGLVCISHDVEEAVDKCNIKGLKTQVIPVGINVNEFQMKQKDNEVPILLWFGRLSKHTKMDLTPLLHIFKKVLESTKAHLLISGASTGERYENEVWNQCKGFGLKENVSIQVSPTHQEKIEIYSTADIFVAPCNNYQESFGINLLEAKASGLPIVASAWSGYKDIVRQGQDGFLIPFKEIKPLDDLHDLGFMQYDGINHHHFSERYPIDVDAFSEAILALIKDKDNRENMGRFGWLDAGIYDWKIIVSEYIEFWSHLCAQEQEHKSYEPIPEYSDVFSHFANHATYV